MSEGLVGIEERAESFIRGLRKLLFSFESIPDELWGICESDDYYIWLQQRIGKLLGKPYYDLQLLRYSMTGGVDYELFVRDSRQVFSVALLGVIMALLSSNLSVFRRDFENLDFSMLSKGQRAFLGTSESHLEFEVDILGTGYALDLDIALLFVGEGISLKYIPFDTGEESFINKVDLKMYVLLRAIDLVDVRTGVLTSSILHDCWLSLGSEDIIVCDKRLTDDKLIGAKFNLGEETFTIKEK